MSRTVKAAVVQAGSFVFDTPRTLEKLADLAAQAQAEGAGLAVFPEAFLGGYPKGHDFGAQVGSRTPEGREVFQRYLEAGIAVPGPETARIGEIAKETGLDIVVGVMERAEGGRGGTLYCTALTFARDGRLLGKRRKLMPTAMERLVWGQGDGSTLDVHDAPAGRIATVICWENYMPLLRVSQYTQGVELYCAPTVDDRENWSALMRTIAMEGRCFVLSSCQYLTRCHLPDGWPETAKGTDGSDGALIKGGSLIVSPFGEVLAGPLWNQEGVITAELDFDLIARGKFDFDVTGHYSRPDVFELQIDRRAKTGLGEA